MRIPITFVVFRVTAVSITVLLLVLFGLGLSGRGPWGDMSGVTHQVADWLSTNTGVGTR